MISEEFMISEKWWNRMSEEERKKALEEFGVDVRSYPMHQWNELPRLLKDHIMIQRVKL